MTKVELLSPAGNFEKLKFAIAYGADATYGGIKGFSLREGAKNFSFEELKEAIDYSHEKGKKFYLALNIFIHEENFKNFKTLLNDIILTKPDGVLISDVGALYYIREKYPELSLHISTQANTLNSEAVKFYEKLGVKRVVLARELTLEEIKKIRGETSIELEVFVHGAMCIAYSGRCLLSNYFTNPVFYTHGKKPSSMKIKKVRDANLGDCSQACRWNYYVVETTRKEDFLPVEIEENFSTTIFSSKDLNLALYMKELIEAGIDSFKIEGRMKSIYYVAITTKVYRNSIDEILGGREISSLLVEELNNVSHREYTTGFFFEKNRLEPHTTFKSYERGLPFYGYLVSKIGENKYHIKTANKITIEDKIEIVTPHKNEILRDFHFLDFENGSQKKVVQPNEDFILVCNNELEDFSILRKSPT